MINYHPGGGQDRGRVRFRATAKPVAGRVCWCTVCQKIGAGGPTVNAAFQTDGLTVEGTLKDYESVADSGNRMHRRFCPACGTHLFSASEARPNLVFIRVGALDDPEIGRPTHTARAASAPSWACIDDTIPRVPGQPPPMSLP